MNRRELLLSAAAFSVPAALARDAGGEPAGKGKLRILILGGTGFIGPHFVREALARGHTVTLFNRGKRQEQPTPGVETLLGDRDGQLGALEGRDWDVVIDNSGYVPRHVRLTTQLLRERVRHYLFISTISVYADLSAPGTTEDAPLKKLADPTVEKVDGETYGGLKALCEGVVLEDFAGRNTIVRPTYIVGPGDHTDRFTYWPWRVSQGGEMLAPGTAADPIQYIDVRDLARFVIGCVEAPTPGIFNACSPPGFATMGGLSRPTSGRRPGRCHGLVRCRSTAAPSTCPISCGGGIRPCTTPRSAPIRRTGWRLRPTTSWSATGPRFCWCAPRTARVPARTTSSTRSRLCACASAPRSCRRCSPMARSTRNSGCRVRTPMRSTPSCARSIRPSRPGSEAPSHSTVTVVER